MEPGALLDAIPWPAILVGRDARIFAANSGAASLLGQGMIGRPYVTMLRQPAILDAVERCLNEQTSHTTQYHSNDGVQDVIYDVTSRYVEGAPGAALICFADTTDLEQADQMRRDFVANVSHELRTPLTSLIGFIETLQGPARDDSAAQARFLGIMQDEAGRMNRLVGDLLSLSRVESEERVRPTEQIELSGLLASVLHNLRPVADEAGVTLVSNFAAKVHVMADPDQLRQLFSNLVENAIKYGGGSDVTVSVTEHDHHAGLRARAAEVCVADAGPGIDPVHLPRLTERFYRVDSHRSRELGGTGLGLAIVKHILNRHRGRLKVDSALGQGARFTVILPSVSHSG